MQAGRLSERVSIERLTSIPDEAGQPVHNWTTLVEDWAEATPLRGREFLAAQQMQETADVRFRLRWREGVTPGDRVVWRGVAHDILAAIDVDARRDVLELMTQSNPRDARES